MTQDTTKEGGWKGRISASLIGGSLLAFSIGLFVTIYVPGYDGLDEAFLGGLALVLLWPVLMLWALFARTTAWAWGRVLVPTVLILTMSVVGLLL
ncbi:MAG: hypothetical protein AAGN66_21725 [Acidobacteriota bacterium]